MDGEQATETPPAAEPVPLRRNRDFTLLWTGQTTSILGSQISIVAYPLLILAVTGSAAQAGIVASASSLGLLLLLLPAGAVADAHPRRRIMVVASLIQMATGATVVPAVYTHHVYLAQLAAVGFVQGVCGAFYQGASKGATRRIVTSEQLPQAMAATEVRDRAALMLGPPAGGALFGLGQALPFACDSVSYGAIALAAALIRKPLDPERPPPRERLHRRVIGGLRFVAGQPFLRLFAGWAAVLNAAVFGVRLTVIVLAERRGASPFEVGALFTVSAACGLAGALAAVPLTKLAKPRTLVLITSWIAPACTVGMIFAPSVWLIAALGGVLGFTIMPVNVVLTVGATRITPDHLQAQVGNTMQLCYTCLSSFSPAVFGALTDRFGPYPAILTGAGIYLALAIWMQVNRSLHLVNDQQAAPGTGTPPARAPSRVWRRARPAGPRKGQAA